MLFVLFSHHYCDLLPRFCSLGLFYLLVHIKMPSAGCWQVVFVNDVAAQVLSVCSPPRSALLWEGKHHFFSNPPQQLCVAAMPFPSITCEPLRGINSSHRPQQWAVGSSGPANAGSQTGAAVARTAPGSIPSSSREKLAQLYLDGGALALGFSKLDQHRLLDQLQQQPHKVPVDITMSLLLNNNLK